MIRYLFKRDTLLATLMVFVVIALLGLIPLNTHVLDPIKLALHDFDYNDLAYSRLNKNKETPVDTSIVIVNIGDAQRSEIATIIQKIQEQHPAAIGVDVLFAKPKSVDDDSLLASLSTTAPNMVMSYQLREDGHELKPNGFLYDQSLQKGFTNFVGEEGGVIRYFSPFIKEGETTYASFAAAVVQKVNPAKYSELKERDHATETINYTHSEDKFLIVDGRELLEGADSVALANKIVLVGFTGASPTDIEDKHFTPMNEHSFGKSLPDMHGVIIHANIIRMILNGDYIGKMPTWVTWLIAVLLCWIHMAVFLMYFVERHLWFHLVAKLAQLISAVFFIYLGLLIFYKGDYKINLAPAFLAIILAVDVLYFYEALCNWLHRKWGLTSVFSQHKH